jgi:hypothetical protein
MHTGMRCGETRRFKRSGNLRHLGRGNWARLGRSDEFWALMGASLGAVCTCGRAAENSYTQSGLRHPRPVTLRRPFEPSRCRPWYRQRPGYVRPKVAEFPPKAVLPCCCVQVWSTLLAIMSHGIGVVSGSKPGPYRMGRGWLRRKQGHERGQAVT